jgi:hypothetical protein
VAVDGQHVYWANFSSNTIGRANLDGSGANQSFIAGASDAIGVAVDGGPPRSASPSPTSLSFASQSVGTFGPPQSLTITNRGHGNLATDTVRIASGDVDDFLVSYETCCAST